MVETVGTYNFSIISDEVKIKGSGYLDIAIFR
jgi:hypothetical protein